MQLFSSCWGPGGGVGEGFRSSGRGFWSYESYAVGFQGLGFQGLGFKGF